VVQQDVLMRILGLSFGYHDSAAALVEDGEVLSAVEEERISRIKHDSGFPKLAAKYCMAHSGISASQLDWVVFYEKPILKFDRIITTLLTNYPWSFRAFTHAVPLWLTNRLRIEKEIQRELDIPADRILFSKHHFSHAASAFYLSGFESAALLTLDGVGEWASGSIGWGEGSKMVVEREMTFPNSLGLFYSLITAYLGFKVNDGEWKVMGLAPYGRPSYLKALSALVTVNDDGSVLLEQRFLKFLRSKSEMFHTDRMTSLLGFPPRPPSSPLSQEHADLAASAQMIFEESLVKTVHFAASRYDTRNLCYAGGAALNSMANRRISATGAVDNVFIQPAAGDSGAAIGCALLAYNHLESRPKRTQMTHAFLGPAFSDEMIETACRELDLLVEPLADDQEIIECAVRLLVAGQVIGWFQGRMEFGPRALGGRSILADPRNEQMKEIINAKVKYRESFRPFAGSIPTEDFSTFFEMDEPSPFMLLVHPVRSEWRKQLAAITHVDGSCRVQTVDSASNALFHGLLKRFGQATGTPVLLNTSFNIRGEPIVCTPAEAIDCFLRTGLDSLILGRYLIRDKVSVRPHSFEEIDQRDTSSSGVRSITD
jgi:carbamoyltransferase